MTTTREESATDVAFKESDPSEQYMVILYVTVSDKDTLHRSVQKAALKNGFSTTEEYDEARNNGLRDPVSYDLLEILPTSALERDTGIIIDDMGAGVM